jgi:hypothetical protein
MMKNKNNSPAGWWSRERQSLVPVIRGLYTDLAAVDSGVDMEKTVRNRPPHTREQQGAGCLSTDEKSY